jgi:hypothetical protein
MSAAAKEVPLVQFFRLGGEFSPQRERAVRDPRREVFVAFIDELIVRCHLAASA